MNMGQSVSGVIDMKVNDDKSYDVTLNSRKEKRERKLMFSCVGWNPRQVYWFLSSPGPDLLRKQIKGN